MTDVYVIANRRAGRGRGLPALREALGAGVTVAETTARGHATLLAAQARRDGRPVVVAAGGDGTVHEVVNGLLGEDAGSLPALGVVPLGSGCDYVRTFAIPSDPAGAATRILQGNEREVDAGEVTHAAGRRFFANIAEAGIGAAVVERASRLPRRLGAGMYAVAFLAELPRFAPARARVVADGVAVQGPMTNLVVAIGRAFGGGMLVAPDADPSDGLFDVQVYTGSKLDYVRGLPGAFRGTHLPHPKIRTMRARTVEVSADRPLLVEADGEVLGRVPATFRVLAGALRLIV